jgi:antirestriction protein ArdC
MNAMKKRADAFCSAIIMSGIWSSASYPPTVLDKLPKIETHQDDPIEAAERIIAEMPDPPEIHYGGSQAFYSPITDRITLPRRELFSSTAELYASAFHELTHSVGHRKRLARESITEAAPFGSPSIPKKS